MKFAVAVDGSQNAMRAAKYAMTLVQHFPESNLKVMFVTDFNKVDDERLLKESPKSLEQYQEQIIRPVLKIAREEGVDAEAVRLKGNPVTEIIKYVTAEEIDHLVVGNRGFNLLKEIVLGPGVAQKVAKHVKCPVTIVK